MKTEITEDMLVAALAAYDVTMRTNAYKSAGMKAALEAGFNHIVDANKKVEQSTDNAHKHTWTVRYERDGDINSPCYAVCTFCGQRPDWKTPEETKAKKELVSDGWIEHKISALPENLYPYTILQIKTVMGAVSTARFDEICQSWWFDARINEVMSGKIITAYRVISEPEEKKEPKKQTFEEFAVRNSPQGNLDILTPGEVICLFSEFYRINAK